jgi:P27 family predicted phage terminase small subunit
MAVRGRRPKPTALHELHGTLNSTRHAARVNEPQAAGSLQLEPPDWLTDSQKDGWRYAMTHAPRNLLAPIDRTILVLWIEAEDRHRRAAIAQALLDKDTALPMLTRRDHGPLRKAEMVESPYIRIMTRAAETLIRCANELGFSPASRPRLAIPPGADDGPAKKSDPWAQLKVLQGGKGSSAA